MRGHKAGRPARITPRDLCHFVSPRRRPAAGNGLKSPCIGTKRTSPYQEQPLALKARASLFGLTGVGAPGTDPVTGIPAPRREYPRHDAIANRLAACKLVPHPDKTKIVYCKDVNRRADFPNIHFDFLGFQFRARKVMWVKAERCIFALRCQPAASPKVLTRICRKSAAGRFITAATSP